MHSWTIRVHDQSRVESVFSDANPRKIVKRGCTTLIAFLLLNIVRDGIPDVVVALTGHPSTLDTFGYDIFASDILGFAGFVFLFFRTCQTFSHCFIATPLISLCMLTVNDLIPPLHNVHWTLRAEAACRTRF